MSEQVAMTAAVILANKLGKAVYVKGFGNQCSVSETGGTFGCTRVLPTV
jgi:hypothetical protein